MGRRSLTANGTKKTKTKLAHLGRQNGRITKPIELDLSQSAVMKRTSVYCRSSDGGNGPTCAMSEGRRTLMHLRPHKTYTPVIGLSRKRIVSQVVRFKAAAAGKHQSLRASSPERMDLPTSCVQGSSLETQEGLTLGGAQQSETPPEICQSPTIRTGSSNGGKNPSKGERSQHGTQEERQESSLHPLPFLSEELIDLDAGKSKASGSVGESDVKTNHSLNEVKPSIGNNGAQSETSKHNLVNMVPKYSRSRQESKSTLKTAMLLRPNKRYVSVFHGKRRSAPAFVTVCSIAPDDHSSNCHLSSADFQTSPCVERQTSKDQDENVNEVPVAALTSPEQRATIQSPKCEHSNVTPTRAMESKCNTNSTSLEVTQSSWVSNSGEERGSLAVLQNLKEASLGSQRIQPTEPGSLDSENMQSVVCTPAGTLQNSLENEQVDNESASVLLKSQMDLRLGSSNHVGSNFTLRNLLSLRPYSNYRLMAGKPLLCATERRHWLLNQPELLRVDDYAPKVLMMLRPYTRYSHSVQKPQFHETRSRHWFLVQGASARNQHAVETPSDNPCKAQEPMESLEKGSVLGNVSLHLPEKASEDVSLPEELSSFSGMLQHVRPCHVKVVDVSPQRTEHSGLEKASEETAASQLAKEGGLDGSLAQDIRLTTKQVFLKRAGQKRKKSAEKNYRLAQKEQAVDQTSESQEQCISDESTEAEEIVSGQTCIDQNTVSGQSCESPVLSTCTSIIDAQNASSGSTLNKDVNPDADSLQELSPAQDIAPESSSARIQVQMQSVSDYSPKILMMMRPYPAYQKVAAKGNLPCKFPGHWLLTRVHGSDSKQKKVDDMVANAKQKSDRHPNIIIKTKSTPQKVERPKRRWRPTEKCLQHQLTKKGKTSKHSTKLSWKLETKVGRPTKKSPKPIFGQKSKSKRRKCSALVTQTLARPSRSHLPEAAICKEKEPDSTHSSLLQEPSDERSSAVQSPVGFPEGLNSPSKPIKVSAERKLVLAKQIRLHKVCLDIHVRGLFKSHHEVSAENQESVVLPAIPDSDGGSGSDNLTTGEQCTGGSSEGGIESKSQAIDNSQPDDAKEESCAANSTVSQSPLPHSEIESLSVEGTIPTTDGMQSLSETDHKSMTEKVEHREDSSRDLGFSTANAADITTETNKYESFADLPDQIVADREEKKSKPVTKITYPTKGRPGRSCQRTTMRLRKKDKHFLFSKLGFKKSKQRAFHVVNNNKHGRGCKSVKSRTGQENRFEHRKGVLGHEQALPDDVLGDSSTCRLRKQEAVFMPVSAISEAQLPPSAELKTKPTRPRGRPRKRRLRKQEAVFMPVSALAEAQLPPIAELKTKPTRPRGRPRKRKRKRSSDENSSPRNRILPSVWKRKKQFGTTEQPSSVHIGLQRLPNVGDATNDALNQPHGRNRKSRLVSRRREDLPSSVANSRRDAPPAGMRSSSPERLPPTKRIKQLIPGYVSPDEEEFTLEEFCSLETLEEAVDMAAREARSEELPHLRAAYRRKMTSHDSKLHKVSSSSDKMSRAKRSSRSPEGSYWDCSVCTYRNKAEAFKCAMCDVRKGTSTRKPRLNAQLVAQQQAQQNLSPLVHVKAVKPASRPSPAQRKTGAPKKPRPRLKNIDRSSAISTEVVVNNIPVIITEYKEKSHTRTTVDSDEASAERTNGNVNGL